MPLDNAVALPLSHFDHRTAHAGSMLSPEQKDRIAELYESGKPISAIAKLLGITVSRVDYFILSDGLVRPSVRQAQNVRPTYMRNGRPVRAYTQDEDKKIIAMEAAGATNAMIAKELDRRPHSVRQRIQTLARRENFEELTVAPPASKLRES